MNWPAYCLYFMIIVVPSYQLILAEEMNEQNNMPQWKTIQNEFEDSNGCTKGKCTKRKYCTWYDSLSFEATGSCADAKPDVWVCCVKRNIFHALDSSNFETTSPTTLSSRSELTIDKVDESITSRGYAGNNRQGWQPSGSYGNDYGWNDVKYEGGRNWPYSGNSNMDGCKPGQCMRSRECRGRYTKASPATGECSRRRGGDWLCCIITKSDSYTESYYSNNGATWKKVSSTPTNLRPGRPTTTITPKTTSTVRHLYKGCGLRAGLSRRSGRIQRSDNSLASDVQLIEANHTGINSIDRSTNARVVGGRETEPFSWPWMAALFKQKNRGMNRFICAGTLISPKFVLSAAHVFTEEDIRESSNFVVRLGTHTGSENFGEYGVKWIQFHPKYQHRYYYYDIALLELDEPVHYNAYVAPVCLPDYTYCQDSELVGKKAILTGWGDETFGGKSSEVMKEATIPIVSRSSCNASYVKVASGKFPKGITDMMLCAGDRTGGNDACQGDSGGPLILEKDNHWIQVGIVSFGYNCGDPQYPGVYTKVAYYVDWINSVISKP